MATKKTQQVATPRSMDALVRGSVKELAHAHHTWVAVVPRPATAEELENPNIWQHMGSVFSKGDRLQIEANDLSMYADAIVTNVKGGDIRVKVLNIYQLDAVLDEEIQIGGFKIRNAGLDRQWEIVHASNGKVLKDEIPTQKDAIVYVQDHIKQVA